MSPAVPMLRTSRLFDELGLAVVFCGSCSRSSTVRTIKIHTAAGGVQVRLQARGKESIVDKRLLVVK